MMVGSNIIVIIHELKSLCSIVFVVILIVTRRGVGAGTAPANAHFCALKFTLLRLEVQFPAARSVSMIETNLVLYIV